MAQNNKMLMLAGIGLVAYFLIKGSGSASSKRKSIVDYVNSGNDTAAGKQQFQTIVNSMSDAEVSAVYDYLFNYVQKGTRPADGSALATQIIAISSKYNIFT